MEHIALRKIAGQLGMSVLTVGLLACGSSAPTHELSDARRAYDDAEDGPAKAHRPAELHAAKRALDRAETAHDQDPGSDREKRLSEVAEHKAEVADARGEATQAEFAAQAAHARADRESNALRGSDERGSMAKADRERAKGDIAMHEQPRAERSAVPTPAAQGSSGDRAHDALQSLTRVSKVTEDDRGVVITLSGSLLFPSGQDELSPVAQQHLDEVCSALREQPKDANFRIEGYTDSSGSARVNQDLSAKRARAVASYLTAHGIETNRTEVVGYGEQRPIADNASEAGRSENRRVEVIIAKPAEHAAL